MLRIIRDLIAAVPLLHMLHQRAATNRDNIRLIPCLKTNLLGYVCDQNLLEEYRQSQGNHKADM